MIGFLKKTTKMFKGLKKEMPELNKSSLARFVKWFEQREKLSKTLKTRELFIPELEDFKDTCFEFKAFGKAHIKEFEKYNIKWGIMEKYLTEDIKFCDKQILILKTIIKTKKKEDKNNKK